MSIRCIKNLRHAKCYNRFMREPVLRREDERFFSDLGECVPTRADVFELASVFGPEVVSFGRHGMKLESHAVPVDCTIAFNSGLMENQRQLELMLDPYDDGYQDWLERQAELAWDALTPRDDVRVAWNEHEHAQWLRKEEELDWMQARVSPDDVPVFLTRADRIVEGAWRCRTEKKTFGTRRPTSGCSMSASAGSRSTAQVPHTQPESPRSGPDPDPTSALIVRSASAIADSWS